MKRFTMLLLLGVAIFALCSRCAQARTHPHPDGYVTNFDAAAQPVYQPVARSSTRHHHVRRHEPRHKVARKAPEKPKHKAIRQAAPTPAPAPVQPVHAGGGRGWQASALGALLGVPGGFEDGVAAERPIIVGSDRPYKLAGQVLIGDARFDFASGGYGRGSIPYGDHLITPHEVGPWGASHGAFGLDHNNDMHDPKYNRAREGIEMHALHRGTLGCFGVENWDKAKKAVLAMIDKFGQAFLHVWPGYYAVTPQRQIDRQIVMIDVRQRRRDEEEEPTHKTASRHQHHRHYAKAHHRHYARHHYRHFARA